MGDRVLIQFISKDGNWFSPVIYGHWAGDCAARALVQLRERMGGRDDDVQYTAARCLQDLGMTNASAESFGIWNAAGELTARDSQGDAGVLLVTLGPVWHVRQLGGYELTTCAHPGIAWDSPVQIE